MVKTPRASGFARDSGEEFSARSRCGSANGPGERDRLGTRPRALRDRRGRQRRHRDVRRHGAARRRLLPDRPRDRRARPGTVPGVDRSRPLTSGPLLASHRALSEERTWLSANGNPILPYHPHTKEAKQPVPAGKVVRLDIEIPPTLARIAKGHHLRLALTSSDFPHLVPIAEDAAALAGGVYEIQRTAEHPSSIEVPLADPTEFELCSVCR